MWGQIWVLDQTALITNFTKVRVVLIFNVFDMSFNHVCNLHNHKWKVGRNPDKFYGTSKIKFGFS